MASRGRAASCLLQRTVRSLAPQHPAGACSRQCSSKLATRPEGKPKVCTVNCCCFRGLFTLTRVCPLFDQPRPLCQPCVRFMQLLVDQHVRLTALSFTSIICHFTHLLFEDVGCEITRAIAKIAYAFRKIEVLFAFIGRTVFVFFQIRETHTDMQTDRQTERDIFNVSQIFTSLDVFQALEAHVRSLARLIWSSGQKW